METKAVILFRQAPTQIQVILVDGEPTWQRHMSLSFIAHPKDQPIEHILWTEATIHSLYHHDRIVVNGPVQLPFVFSDNDKRITYDNIMDENSHEIILDTVFGNDAKDDNYLLAYCKQYNITMSIVEWTGPAGGNPAILYKGSYDSLKHLLHDIFDLDGYAWMIIKSK